MIYKTLKCPTVFADMKRTILLILLGYVFFVSCSNSGSNTEQFEPPYSLTTIVTGYNEFNSALLNITEANMKRAGFTPGDMLMVITMGDTLHLPYHTGYFGKLGDMLIVDRPMGDNTMISGVTTGLEGKYLNLTGQTVQLMLEGKGIVLNMENLLGRQYSTDRNDYVSDEVFANARAVSVTGIAENRLYRSVSPFDDRNMRAYYASAFIQKHGVKTILDLADTEKDLASYPSLPPYSQEMVDGGHVICCRLSTNYRSEAFNSTLIQGLIEMSRRPAPYLVNCLEGKDRTGYACALLEALCGADYNEIISDYLTTYANYYDITPETNPEGCRLLTELFIGDALAFYCGVQDQRQLKSINLQAAVARFLLAHGMTQEQLDRLVAVLQN